MLIIQKKRNSFKKFLLLYLFLFFLNQTERQGFFCITKKKAERMGERVCVRENRNLRDTKKKDK
jgi:hypothetical protein